MRPDARQWFTAPPPRQPGRAALAVSVAVLMWGYSNVAIKWVSTTGIVTSFYRLWFAIPLLWLIPVFDADMRRRLDHRWLVGCVTGGTLFALHQILFFTSLKLTTVTNVTVIGALQPALVLLLAGPVFAERMTHRDLVCSVIAFAATFLVVLGGRDASTSSLEGDGLAVANLFAFTGYLLVSKRVRLSVPAWDYVVGMTTVSGVWILAVALATGQALDSPRPSEWPVLVLVAIFPGTLGHFLINWAHAHTSAFAVSMILLAVPVVAVFGAVTLLGERVAPLQLLGGIGVLVAIGTIVGSSSRDVGEELAKGAAETDAP